MIDQWHKERGWRGCGYHYIINNGCPENGALFLPEWDGRIEPGRDLELIGAHCRGENHDSIGICLVGKHHFTLNEFVQLVHLVHQLRRRFGFLTVHGHRDYNKKKTCPNFEVRDMLITIGEDGDGNN